jgi:glutamine synthetase
MAEYVWLDGATPTQQLRSKGRVVQLENPENPSLASFPKWSYDGSSTNQSTGSNSDLMLHPVRHFPDPTRGPDNYIVLCEVFNPDGTAHSSNSRATLRQVLESGGAESDPWFGFEQEYTLFDGTRPLGWPENGYPEPQGPFYCGVGSGKVHGRDLVEEHTAACLEAGLLIYGINAEVMPGQWEFQIGYRGFDNEEINGLQLCDHLWIARFLLHRLGEEHNVRVSFDNKPMSGDWNGAGCHTNLSTKELRDPTKGLKVLNKILDSLKNKHLEHVAVYGHGLDQRLTGLHETCSINEFRSGVSDRGASIRIPQQVQEDGSG